MTFEANASVTLLDVFQKRDASKHPALIIPDHEPPTTLDYGQLHRVCARLANALSNQLHPKPADVITFVLPNGIEWAAVFFACTGLGLVAAPLNSAYSEHEFNYFIQNAGSQVVIVPHDWVSEERSEKPPAVLAALKLHCQILGVTWTGEKVSLTALAPDGSLVPVADETMDEIEWSAQPDNVALVLHTSGTTGRSKCVPLTHRNLRTTTENVRRTYHLEATDRTLIVMPLFHVHGLVAALLSTLISGGTCVVPPKFSASKFWDQIQQHEVTWYTAVPTIHSILLLHPIPNPLPKLRFIRSCSASLAPSVFHQIESLFQAPVLEAYAMTEAAHQMTSNPYPPAVRKPGSVGLPQGIQLSIRDDKGNSLPQQADGEVCVRGENVTLGYWNNDEANAASFFEGHWLRTGDLGYLDHDGYLFLKGRIKELINRGGEKISPVEIDSVLIACPGVREAVSFGISGGIFGEEVGCAVVSERIDIETQGEAEKAAEKERLLAYCREKLADFKIPKHLYLLNAIPKTATGKVQRRIVAEKIKEQTDDSTQ